MVRVLLLLPVLVLVPFLTLALALLPSCFGDSLAEVTPLHVLFVELLYAVTDLGPMELDVRNLVSVLAPVACAG